VNNTSTNTTHQNGKAELPPASLEFFWQRQGLTRREADVLRWLTIGKTNPEIGIILGISPLTVKTHVAHIFAKLDVETRTAASLRAMELLRDTRGQQLAIR
jgi:DNA-binding CsgD family transcriptional regulator